MGKAQSAKFLAEPLACLELNMQGAVQPDLREYDEEKHSVILFDEVSCKQVLQCKKLFQASVGWVTLGSSPTNTLTYKVCVHQKLLVCATNVWETELEQLSHADYDWLKENSVVVKVSKPLYET